jgi:predicted DNA-binding transcriptional regulator AlpA
MNTSSIPPRPTVAEPLAVGAAEAARLCGISRSTFLAHLATGHVPLGVRIGRRRVWPIADLRAWLLAGCPERHRWDNMKKLKQGAAA